MGCDFGKDTKDSLICTIDNKDCIYYLPSIGKCYEERHTFYHQYIKLLNQEVKWISVKERLPKPYRTVLVFSYSAIIGYYAPGDGWYEGGLLGREIDKVTHWMELPEPPKDGDSHD